MRSFPLFSIIFALVFAPLGCGGEHDTTSARSSVSSSAGGTDAGGFTPAPHAPFPRVESLGGPVLAHPHVITVTFSGYPLQTDVQAFGAWIASSDWLAATGAEYGIGNGAHQADIILPEPPPSHITNGEIITLLSSLIDDGTLPDPATIEDPLYLIYFPHGTFILDFGGVDTCGGQDSGGGYHWEADHEGTKFAYAVIPTCAASLARALAYVEESAGHEVIEAATDPFPRTDVGWVLYDDQDPWAVVLQNEVGDLCQFMPHDVDQGFTVPRAWSNRAAAMGHDPCIPAPDEPFQNVTSSPRRVQSLSPGESMTFELTGWSTAAVPPWKLWAAAWGDFKPAATLARKTISNGEKVTLTVSAPTSAAHGAQGNVLVYSIRDLQQGHYAYWPIVVRVP